MLFYELFTCSLKKNRCRVKKTSINYKNIFVKNLSLLFMFVYLFQVTQKTNNKILIIIFLIKVNLVFKKMLEFKLDKIKYKRLTWHIMISIMSAYDDGLVDIPSQMSWNRDSDPQINTIRLDRPSIKHYLINKIMSLEANKSLQEDGGFQTCELCTRLIFVFVMLWI